MEAHSLNAGFSPAQEDCDQFKETRVYIPLYQKENRRSQSFLQRWHSDMEIGLAV